MTAVTLTLLKHNSLLSKSIKLHKDTHRHTHTIHGCPQTHPVMFYSPSCYQSYVWDTSHYPITHTHTYRHICKMLTKLNLNHLQQMCNDWTPILQKSTLTYTLWPALAQMHPSYHVCPCIRPSDRSQWAICLQQNERRKEMPPDSKPHLQV